ncbi:MAG TPA: hypothetical protein VNU68_34765 [Verrucomicrobiae bacterium]|nr:hypothetical protein [Verrucomicrobiae bacterium]
MQSIGIIGAVKTAGINNTSNNGIGLLSRLTAPIASKDLTPMAPVVSANDVPLTKPLPEIVADVAGLKSGFQTALRAHHTAKVSLSEKVAELIAHGVSRDTAIAWGRETGLSDSYVRGTVSGMYLSLTGKRERAKGAGRKANKGAAAMAIRALKDCDGDVSDAKALLLAARRLIEAWEATGTVASHVASGE